MAKAKFLNHFSAFRTGSEKAIRHLASWFDKKIKRCYFSSKFAPC